MATNYDLIPSLVERVAASQLVVISTGGRLVDLQRDRTEGPPRIFGLFEIEVEEVLDGELPAGRLLVRVLGEGQDEQARWLVPLGAGRHVLILTRDVGPGLPEDLYAPVFASGFRIDGGRIDLPAEAVDDRTRKLADVRDGHTTPDGLRRLLQAVRTEQAEARQRLERFLPPEALRRPYPKTEEIPPRFDDVPTAETGATTVAGRAAEIGRAPEADSR